MYEEIKMAIESVQHGAKRAEYEDTDYEILAYRVMNLIRVDIKPKTSKILESVAESGAYEKFMKGS